MVLALNLFTALILEVSTIEVQINLNKFFVQIIRQVMTSDTLESASEKILCNLFQQKKGTKQEIHSCTQMFCPVLLHTATYSWFNEFHFYFFHNLIVLFYPIIWTTIAFSLSQFFKYQQPGRVAQPVTCLATDASLTADPGVASSILARSHSFVELDHEIISKVILLPPA